MTRWNTSAPLFSTLDYEQTLTVEGVGLDPESLLMPSTRSSASMQWLHACLANLEKYFVPLVILVGMVGNTFSFVVFLATHLKRSSCNIYLASLAMANNAFLFCVFVSWSQYLGVSLYNQQGWCQVLVYLTHVSSFLSVWYVVSFTVERYIIVCLPDKRTVLCTATMAKRIVLLLTVFALVAYSFTTFTSGVIRLAGMNICVPLREFYRIVFSLTNIDTFVTLIIPTVIVIGCNIRISYVVWTFYRNYKMTSFSRHMVHKWNFSKRRATPTTRTLCVRRDVGTSNRVLSMTGSCHIRATRMLLIVSTVFLVCNLPSHAVRTYVLFMQLADTDYQPTVPVMLSQKFFNIIYYINFSVNFFLYSLSGRSFRTGMQRLCVKVRKKLSSFKCKKPLIGSPTNSSQPYCSTRSEYFLSSGHALRMQSGVTH